jgi:HEAT repeat protein
MKTAEPTTAANWRLASVGGSDVTLLSSLWLSSLLLAGLALLWMGGLVLARVNRERSIQQRAFDHRAVLHAFVAIMGGAGDAVAQLSPYQRRSCLIAEALLETLALVRGRERDRLMAALLALNIDDRLRSRLFTHDIVGRIACAEALSALPSDRTVAALDRVWRSASDPVLRLAALRSLTDMGENPPITEVLAELARRASDPLTFQPLLRRLAQDDTQGALEAFADVRLAQSARAMLADALGATGDFLVLPTLLKATAEANPAVREAALRGLGSLAHPAAEAAVAARMTDAVWEVRAAAGDAAGRIGVVALIPALVAQLEDPVWWVRFRAAEALALMGDKGVRTLRLAAGAPADFTRRAASLVLAEKGFA